MAANNYFGFTHGGTQYGTQPTGSYQAAAPATYAVHTTHQGTYAAAPRQAPATYEAYPTTHTSAQYAYSTRQQDAPPPPPASSQSYTDQYGYTRSATSTYDKTQSYYQAAQSSYSAGDTTAHYQTENIYSSLTNPSDLGTTKPAYSTNSTYSTSTNRPSTAQKAANQSSSAATYVYPTTTSSSSYSQSPSYVSTTTSANYGGTYSGYDAAVYSAATMYVQQQQTAKTPATGWTYKKQGNKPNKQKAPPKPPQLHYCDICKISCAGPQTYREHLEGQKHKKKEASSKIGTQTSSRGGNSLRCELCDVTCTGTDAYAAHIRGAKHQKVVKLHTKLGKPIPSNEPVVIATQNSTSSGGKAGSGKSEDGKNDSDGGEGKSDVTKIEDKSSEVQPVGQDYIEEIKNDDGKVISFQCKLCECRFNDPNAKEMHMKGRRHRLQYKKKVNPDLVVDVKPSIRARKLQEEKMRRQVQKDEFWRRREEERWRMMEEEERMYWEDRRRYEEEMEFYEWHRRHGRDPRAVPPRPHPQGTGVPHIVRRPETSDDRHVMAKHTSIYPNEAELQAVQNIVSNTEKALKLVSDQIADCDNPKPTESEKTENKQEIETKEEEKKEETTTNTRALKGVMRVGVLAKGLLLHGDLNVHLVVLCSEKPTRTLLVRVADTLPKQIATVTEEKYDLKLCVEEASIILTSLTDPKTSVTITLTSPVMRESNQPESGGEGVNVKDPPDVLDRQKCLDALAALRHAKWFQARANGLQSCVIVIRILRDLCQRVPTWGPLNSWAMELLVEKVISSAGAGLSPGDALRRVFEAIASGILLPGGPGLMDPCEKDPTDAAASLTSQEREDITSSAQHALRLLAFRQIHKVLGMDPLPVPRFIRQRFNPRKRRRDNSSGEPGEEGDGKKDKKEEGEADAMETNETQASA